MRGIGTRCDTRQDKTKGKRKEDQQWLERWFSLRISLYFALFTFPPILTSLPVPAVKKHPHSKMLPPPCFTVGMVQTWRIQAKEFNLSFIRPENLVSHGLRVLWVPFGKLQAGCHAFYWGVASFWSLYNKGMIGGVLQRWLSFWKVLPSPQMNSVALSVWFLVTSLTKALLPRLPSLAGRPALGRVLVVPNFFHLRMMEATVFLRNTADMFWYPSPDLWLNIILSRSSTAISSTSPLAFCSDMHCQLLDLA